MGRRSRPKKRAARKPFREPVQDTHVTLNRSTGQGYLLLPDRDGNNQRHYVGTLLDDDGNVRPETMQRAARVLAEHRAGAHRDDDAVSVNDVLDAFRRSVQEHASTTDLFHFDGAFAPARDLYGPRPATSFGPLALQAVRERMIESGRLNRTTLNDRVRRIVAAFKWAVSREMVPPSVYQGLTSVGGIKRGRVQGLRERRVVESVPDDQVDAVLPFLSEQVRAIVELMRLSGARCAEIVQLRPADVNRSSEPWMFAPRTHKSAHLEKPRVIAFEPRARAVLRPWLLRPEDRHCFRPIEAEEARLQARHAARVTPESHGNSPGTNRRSSPQKRLGDAYTTAVVRRAIERACDRARVPRWTPHRLRHSAATRVQSEAGFEAARLVLGHASVDVTQMYVDRDQQLVADVMEKMG